MCVCVWGGRVYGRDLAPEEHEDACELLGREVDEAVEPHQEAFVFIIVFNFVVVFVVVVSVFFFAGVGVGQDGWDVEVDTLPRVEARVVHRPPVPVLEVELLCMGVCVGVF